MNKTCQCGSVGGKVIWEIIWEICEGLLVGDWYSRLIQGSK